MSGVGVTILIKENLVYKCRDDLNLFIDSTELIFIELSKENNSYSKNVIIGLIYRPPDIDMNILIVV